MTDAHVSRRGGRPGADPQALARLIADAGLDYRQTAKSFVFSCPLCRKVDGLYVFKGTGRFKCMKCGDTDGFKGAPEYALKELTGRPLQDLRVALYGTAEVAASLGFDPRFDSELVEGDDEGEVVEVVDPLPDLAWPYYCLTLDRPGAARGVAYLEGRGVPRDVAMAYDIRYSPQDRSVVFPVWMGTCLVGWQIRTTDPARWMTPEGPKERLKVLSQGELAGNRDRCVMFANQLMGSAHAVICEGPVSALKAHLVGGNVATMGKEISPGQIGMLLRSGVTRFYLALDPDAVRSIDPVLEKIGDQPTFLVKVPPGPKGTRDLGDCTFEEARELVLGAEPLKRGRLHVFFKEAHLVQEAHQR